MLEKKPKQNNKPLSIYYLCRIQKLGNITNKSLKFSAPDLEHGKASLSVPGWRGNSAGERRHGGSEKGLIAASRSNSYQRKGRARDFCSASAALYTPFLLVQSSARAPEPQGTDPWAPAPRSVPDLCPPGLLPPSPEHRRPDLAAGSGQALERLGFSFRHNTDYKL